MVLDPCGSDLQTEIPKGQGMDNMSFCLSGASAFYYSNHNPSLHDPTLHLQWGFDHGSFLMGILHPTKHPEQNSEIGQLFFFFCLNCCLSFLLSNQHSQKFYENRDVVHIYILGASTGPGIPDGISIYVLHILMMKWLYMQTIFFIVPVGSYSNNKQAKVKQIRVRVCLKH